MDKPLASVTIDPDTAARIAKRARETGLSPEELVASLVRQDDEGEVVDASDIQELDARWVEVDAGGETIPHEEVKRWLKTWGTPSFRPWSDRR